MKNITITTGKKITLKDLEKVDISISDWAKELLAKTSFSGKKEQIDLVVLTPRELGFTEWPTTTALYMRAKKKGYELCPAEVGPLLRLNYEQPTNEYLYVAMEPITDSGGCPGIFYVGRRGVGERWLDAVWMRPGRVWDLGDEVVFRLRKSLVPESSASSVPESLGLDSAPAKGSDKEVVEVETLVTRILYKGKFYKLEE